MSDTPPAAPAPASAPAPAPATKAAKATPVGQVAAPTPLPTPDFRASEQVIFNRILGRDDAARAKADTVTLVAITSFTMVEDDEVGLPAERVVNAGEEFDISAYDLPRYAGRGRPKVLDNPHPAGVTITRE